MVHIDWFPALTILFLIAISIAFFLTFLFQFARSFFINTNNKFSTYVLLTLVVIEYFLLIFIVYLHIVNPYTFGHRFLEGWHYEEPPVCINPTINYLLAAVYFLICVTTFKHTVPLFKINFKRFCAFSLATSFIIVIIINAIQQIKEWKAVKASNSFWLFIILLAAGLFIYMLTRFRIDKQNTIKTIFLTWVPITLFFLCFIFIHLKFIYLSGGEYSDIFRGLIP